VARMERLTCSPGRAVAMWRAAYATDLSNVLASVSVPTLVIHMLNNIFGDSYLAELIPGARYVEVPGDPGFAGTDDGRAGAEIEEFLTGVRHGRAPERVLATVVFTDIVESTARAARVGDTAWLSVLERHDQLSRQHADRFGGRIVKSTGDGLLATFDGPARAVGFALAMRDGVKAFALTIRAGVHTGEVELRDQDIGGLGVHIAARIWPSQMRFSLAGRSKTSPRGRASRSLIADPTHSRAYPKTGRSSRSVPIERSAPKAVRRARGCEHEYPAGSSSAHISA
jgi:hypothetical protein